MRHMRVYSKKLTNLNKKSTFSFSLPNIQLIQLDPTA